MNERQRCRWRSGATGPKHRPARWRARRAMVGLLVALTVICGPATVAWTQTVDCPEPNNDLSTACDLGNDALLQGVLDNPGDIDVHRLNLTTGGRVQADLTDLPADYDLYLSDANGGVVGQSVHEGTTPEQLTL